MAKACEKCGLLRSMGRTGVCWDNVGAERLWSKFKHEHHYRHSYVHRCELVAAVYHWFDYYKHDTVTLLGRDAQYHRLRDATHCGRSGRVTTLHYWGALTASSVLNA